MSAAALRFEGLLRTSRLALYAARAGDGPPLLYLGGSGFDMRIGRPVFASALPRHFELVAFEARGLGRSERPAGPWTMQDYADDACALMDALGWARAHVVGESFGAMTAAELAIRHPTRVSALCLMAGAAGGAGGSSYPIERLLPLSGRARAIAALGVLDLRFDALRQSDPAAAERRIRSRMDTDATFLADAGNADGYPRLLAARATHDVHSRLGRIQAPTVVMAGRHDGQSPLANGLALAAGIPGALCWTFDGGHAFAFETPEPMARLIARWLPG